MGSWTAGWWSALRARWVFIRDRMNGLPGGTRGYISRRGAYPGSRSRYFQVHAPRPGLVRVKRPLVVVLHGCRQDHNAIAEISGFRELADAKGFIVAFPFITSYSGIRGENCWGWWLESERWQGAGEVEDLWQIIEQIRESHDVDEQRIHLVGLSSGAGMALALAASRHPSLASAAVVAGVPFGEGAESVQYLPHSIAVHKPLPVLVEMLEKSLGKWTRALPLMVVHSRDDKLVTFRSAENIRDSWTAAFGANSALADSVESGQDGTVRWERAIHNHPDTGQRVLETLFLDGPGHGWYGGRAGQFSFPGGPDTAAESWMFFDAHRRGD